MTKFGQQFSDGSVPEEVASQYRAEIVALREDISANTYLTTTGGGCLAIEVMLGDVDDESGYYPHILITDKGDGTLRPGSTDGYLVGLYYERNQFGEGVFDDLDYQDAPHSPQGVVNVVRELQERAGLN